MRITKIEGRHIFVDNDGSREVYIFWQKDTLFKKRLGILRLSGNNVVLDMPNVSQWARVVLKSALEYVLGRNIKQGTSLTLDNKDALFVWITWCDFYSEEIPCNLID